ncbi:MAG: hypothetical protein HGA37_04430 [Lentimicrobium sp.]|nr:hypothetical protein [Lentimicrobium sp.]
MKQPAKPKNVKSSVPIAMSSGKTENPVNPLLALVFFATVLIPTYTPHFNTLDANGPKFLALSLISIVVVAYLYVTDFFKKYPWFFRGFFTEPPVIAFIALLLLSALSMIKSISLPESVLHLAKNYSVFFSVFVFSLLFMREQRLLQWVAIGLSLLLIIESIAVFANIAKFISGSIAAIADIKTVYSNKNILASALFVKLVFALWLLIAGRGYVRWLGWIAVFTGVLATFFMATRAFYLGTLVLTAVMLIYYGVDYFRFRRREGLKTAGIFLLAVLLAFGTFSFFQQALYPKADTSRHTQAVSEQLATLGNIEEAGGGRLDGWRWSWQMIRENPLLGVGAGNWKINELRFEHPTDAGFTHLFKAHNDFFETAAETGIPGFLAYVAILLFTFLSFLFIRKKGTAPPDYLKPYLFIAPVGIAFYSVDAFFNFPSDRTEIQILFALFIAAATRSLFWLRYESHPETNDQTGRSGNALFVSASAVLVLIQLSVVFVLWLNFQSLRTQFIAFPEITGGELKHNSATIVSGFPWLPDITSWGESVDVTKARYLINDKRYDEAFKLLLEDTSNPWDPRREYFISWMYDLRKQSDSSIWYMGRAMAMKPLHFKYVQNYSIYLENSGNADSAIANYKSYIARNTKNAEAWTNLAGVYQRKGNLSLALQTMVTADSLIPGQKNLQDLKNTLSRKIYVDPYLPLFSVAYNDFNAGRFVAALRNMNAFIEKVPDYADAYSLRAYISVEMKDYSQCLSDARKSISLNNQLPSMTNLEGVALLHMDQRDEACRKFEEAIKLGDPSARSNFDKHCSASPVQPAPQ